LAGDDDAMLGLAPSWRACVTVRFTPKHSRGQAEQDAIDQKPTSGGTLSVTVCEIAQRVVPHAAIPPE
jgi:hypothetical protein